MSCSSSWRNGVVVVLATCGAISCGSEAGPDAGTPLRPSFSAVAAPTFSTTLSPTRSDSDVGPITLGNYPNPTLAVVQVSGLINQYYSNSTGWILPPPNGDLRGTLKGQQDAAGQFNGTAYQCDLSPELGHRPIGGGG
jgi:hypothetical protein